MEVGAGLEASAGAGMSAAAKAGAGIAAVLLAGSLAAETLVNEEGWVLVGYPDPGYGAKIATACAGVTRGVELNKKYSEPECRTKTAVAMIEIGFQIAACLPEELPAQTRAAFTRFAYNIGSPRFCTSETAKAARVGNLKVACVRINQRPDGKLQWVTSNGIVFAGLVKRRASERAQCEAGLT